MSTHPTMGLRCCRCCGGGCQNGGGREERSFGARLWDVLLERGTVFGRGDDAVLGCNVRPLEHLLRMAQPNQQVAVPPSVRPDRHAHHRVADQQVRRDRPGLDHRPEHLMMSISLQLQ